MKITCELLTRIGAWEQAVTAFAERFPSGLDITGEPDSGTILRLVDRPTVVGRVAIVVLNGEAGARYFDETNATWHAYDRFSVSEAHTNPEKYRAAHDAHAMACGVSLWRLLADPNNILPEYR